MITLDDMLDIACLTREEVEAVALQEGIAEVDAVRLGEYLMHVRHGPQAAQAMSVTTCVRRPGRGMARAWVLFATLQAFVAAHPAAVRGSG